MLVNKGSIYYCVGCLPRKVLTATLHEVFPGSLLRRLCVEYSIQIPVCPACHNACHGRIDKKYNGLFKDMSQQEIKEWYCQWSETDFVETQQALMIIGNRSYLWGTKVQREDKIMECLQE